MPKSELERAVERWLEHAQGDLLSAKAILRDEHLPPRVACFLAQQAAEKAVKAVLVAKQIDVPRTHDLEALVALIPANSQLKEMIAVLGGMSQWAVEARYPGDWPEATRQEAAEAVSVAGEALTLCRSLASRV